MNTLTILKKTRPKDRFFRANLLLFVLLLFAVWLFPNLSFGDLYTEKRYHNLTRFLTEIVPYPIRKGEDISLFSWALQLGKDPGLEASLTTLSISLAAIILAGALALLFLPLASRNLMSPQAFLYSTRFVFWKTLLYRTTCFLTRLLLIFMRSIPEYIWAFLFLAIFGIHAWPAVLALALHNMGILGRLGSEVVENIPQQTPRTLRGFGASRLQILMGNILPESFNRFLIYLFYRWETCVREATVLGLLGFSSLGFWIQDARARDYYDKMLFFLLLGALLVLLGDLLSALARHWIRKSSV